MYVSSQKKGFFWLSIQTRAQIDRVLLHQDNAIPYSYNQPVNEVSCNRMTIAQGWVFRLTLSQKGAINTCPKSQSL
jgi:hypothetical protein